MIDTHAHLHFADAFSDPAEVLDRARQAGITTIINVGVNYADSLAAIRFASEPAHHLQKTGVKLFATAGLHPHAAASLPEVVGGLADLAPEVIAIGECGLDYFRNQATKQEQDRALRAQIEIALAHRLPLVFHVREAWDDFFRVLKDYPQARGVLHCFNGHEAEVDRALEHNGELYFGLNGIITFTKDDRQLAAARCVPAERLLTETDCPYLAPTPHRGKTNEPAFIADIVEFLSILRAVEAANLVRQVSTNSEKLFGISL